MNVESPLLQKSVNFVQLIYTSLTLLGIFFVSALNYSTRLSQNEYQIAEERKQIEIIITKNDVQDLMISNTNNSLSEIKADLRWIKERLQSNERK